MILTCFARLPSGSRATDAASDAILEGSEALCAPELPVVLGPPVNVGRDGGHSRPRIFLSIQTVNCFTLEPLN
jgi:hypothetical protein